MEDASSLPYFLLSSSSSVSGEAQSQILTPSCHSITEREAIVASTMTQSDTSLSPHVHSLPLTSVTTTSMSDSLMTEGGDTVPLTAVPVAFTSDGHVTRILEMGTITENGQMVNVKHDCDGIGTSPVTRSEEFPALFRTSSGCTVDLLSTMTDAKPVMALLQPAHEGVVSTTCSSAVLSKAENGAGNDMLMSREMLTDLQSPTSIASLQSSVELQVVRTTSDLPVVLSGTGLTLNAASEGKPQDIYVKSAPAELGKVLCDDVNNLVTNVTPASIPVVLKTDSAAATLPMVFTEAGGGLEMESSAAEKAEISPSTIFPEGAVLVETPQGLMLSVGDELRAVTLTEGPDSQGNHLLSISNNCIPVALLSPCQQGGLMEEQGGGVVYEGSREREVGAEGSPVICSTELPLVTQQVLTVTTPEDEEPKKKNRGWPKGKKRKTAPEISGPRAPMTGYVLFAINRRQEIKQSHPHLPFTEVTKVLGQEWSSMPLDKKQKYLDEAENDKQRYIDELKQFQKSDVYQTLVKKKQLKGDDAADDIGDEMEDDRDELHCKVCKLYFSSLHNKKEHLLGRQHLQAITDQLKKELKKQQKEQEADLRGEPLVAMEMGALGKNAGPLVSDPGDGHSDQCNCQANRPVDVNSFIIDFVHKNHEREQEICTLRRILRKDVQDNWSICKQLQELKDHENKLRQDLRNLAAHAAILTDRINTLKMVPALFGVVDF